MRASLVADAKGVVDEVAVPGPPLDTEGEPSLVDAADSGGAPAAKASMVRF